MSRETEDDDIVRLMEPEGWFDVPAHWVECPNCDDYQCLIHLEHVQDCDCPHVDEWEDSPYGVPVKQAGSAQKPGMVTEAEMAEWLVRNRALILLLIALGLTLILMKINIMTLAMSTPLAVVHPYDRH